MVGSLAGAVREILGASRTERRPKGKALLAEGLRELGASLVAQLVK
jgi:hypothetical protein